MNIFSIAVNIHDHNWYDGKTHRQEERHTKVKHNLNPDNSHDPEPSRTFFRQHFIPNYKKQKQNDVFCFTVSNLGQEFVRDLLEATIGELDFLEFRPQNLWDYYSTDSYYYIDHHQSHAAYAFLTSGHKESDILAIDGRGWQFNCMFVDSAGNIIDLSKELSIGGLWNRLAQDIGLGYLGAGKVMGLAGYGKWDEDIADMIDLYLENPNHKLPNGAYDLLAKTPKENTARTLQIKTEQLIREHVYPLKTSDCLCVAGGVAYNGYVNEMLTEHYTHVYVPPAVGDEGQAIGAYMHADHMLNNNVHKTTVYAGTDWEIDTALFEDFEWQEKTFDEISNEVAAEIANGSIVGWFQGKSESGNRALGNRSILADPRNRNIKDIINHTIKKREDFRPFAPAVLEDYYQDYFYTNQPSPYMSRIVPVISNEIPGVTHVDGTARIQTVTMKSNERFYNLINQFYKQTGIPMLLNTSFNCQEPIVETPEDSVTTFKKSDLDILVINNFILRKRYD
jgi:carbamoyltransferase